MSLALYHRDRTGEGQVAAGSLLGASILTVSETIVLDDGTLSPFRRLDARQLGVGPERRLYAVKDGWIALVAEGAGVFDRLCLLAGAANAEALEPILSAQSTTAVIAMENERSEEHKSELQSIMR